MQKYFSKIFFNRQSIKIYLFTINFSVLVIDKKYLCVMAKCEHNSIKRNL
jgi:hypothetical protein